MNRETTYRNCSISGASPIGLLLALFDRLAADMGRAATAIRSNDIEGRCREINHALIIVGQLESWVDKEKGGESARQLASYYVYLRAKMMEASAKLSAEILESLIESILHVRSSWQALDTTAPLSAPAGGSSYASAGAVSSYQSAEPRVRFSQSA